MQHCKVVWEDVLRPLSHCKTSAMIAVHAHKCTLANNLHILTSALVMMLVMLTVLALIHASDMTPLM